MKFIWATRGRTWGFRFLDDGGFDDPLIVYEAAFSQIGDEPEEWGRDDDMVALRFPDPEGRRDAASRVIPHDFVIFGSESRRIVSFDDGRQLIWPLVSAEFARVWQMPEPPPSTRRTNSA